MINKELFIEVFDLLKSSNFSLSTVESFTGGLYASNITYIPGASSFFVGSIVTYSTQLKINLLNVDADRVEKYGVVSKEIAHDMALYGNKKTKTDIVISFTGNAGPTTCDGGKPVGFFYIGLFFKGIIETFEYKLDLERNELREEAVNIANKILKNKLEIFLSNHTYVEKV